VSTEAPLLVLHDAGDDGGGSQWATTLEVEGWPGPVWAPDLPGHASAPAPVGGSYELADAALTALGVVGAAADARRPVVMGIGANGWAAEIMALGGRACGLVLVDGLSGPWVEPAEMVRLSREWLRAVGEDEQALAPAPASGLDPRLRHGLMPHGSHKLAGRAARAVPVPVLVVETPASPMSVRDVEALMDEFGSATCARVPTGDPAAVAASVVAWATATDLTEVPTQITG
jgi:hypothetical protein